MAGPTQAADRTADGRRSADPPTGGPGEPAGSPGSSGPEGGRRFRLPGRRTLPALGVLAVLLGAFGLWALYGSSWLRAEKVSVEGIRVLTERRVRAVADVPVGAPLASVDTSAVERRILRELRRAEEVRVERSWPHDIRVHVTERRPVLLLPKGGRGGDDRRYVEVDAEGVRFATVDKAPEGVPLLVLEPRGDAVARQYSGPTRLRRAAADVVTALPDRVRRDARTVRVGSYDAITVELTGGRTVRWGSPERPVDKATALTAVMRAAKDAAHFDVSAPGAPATGD